jgi:cytochrome P450
MTTEGVAALDPARIRELFDLRNRAHASLTGGFEDDPYPAFHRLREGGPVHEGTIGQLIGFDGPELFQGLPFPGRRHFCAFDFETCDAIVRDQVTFSSQSIFPQVGPSRVDQSILGMDGEQHRRYRTIVQPSFLPRRAIWWIEKWINNTVHALIDSIEADGGADLNTQFCAAIPLLTICGSFGVSAAEALDIRAALTPGQTSASQSASSQHEPGGEAGRFEEILRPIIEARRAEPQDDVISLLAQTTLSEGDSSHALSDDEILAFANILLLAGSGTTWKQMGITLYAMLTHHEWIDAVVAKGDVLRAVVEEGLRWMPTAPTFARSVIRDVTLGGVRLEAGSIVHPCFAAANRDPARWERPDEFDPARPLQPHLAFGNGPHICLGMHLARAEIVTAINALVDRLANLRLDPNAEPPRIIGLYERGPTAIPAVWG